MNFFHNGNVTGWYDSMGENPFKIHRRSGHLHEETNIFSGEKTTHYDKDDPHESPKSLFRHLITNKWVQITALTLIADQVLNDGQGRKTTIKSIKKFLS